MGIVFSCAIIGLLKASKIKEMVLNRIGLASLFIMATHEPLPILLMCSKAMTRIIPKQDVIDIRYITYCFITLILVLFIESIGFFLWDRVKKKAKGKEYLEFLKYC